MGFTMKHFVLGTAGHIDHGKTALIKALTGIDTDRLKEEKERGITIDLGFAHLELPGGDILGIVDVPGHERFVKNMVAGASGIDLVMLVIAADEGVMPQTREHMEICELLGIRNGIVVITKIDMVDEELLELVREDVKEFISGTTLRDAPIIEVSSVTGKGIDRLKSVLSELIKDLPEKDKGIFFRLPIDRVFIKRGFGTIVTGTAISGKISVGDEVSIYPKDILAKIRGIQIHGRDSQKALAGFRTALNLQGVEKVELKRGDIVAQRDSLKVSDTMNVYLELLPSAPRPLRHMDMVRFHAGTAEIISKVALLDRKELRQGDWCYAQIRLDQPTALLAKDRFVLRTFSPVRTIGGGKILNPISKRRRRRLKALVRDLEILDRGDLKDVILQHVKIGGFEGGALSDLPVLTNSPVEEIRRVCERLEAENRLISLDSENNQFVHMDIFEKARKQILDTLYKYHNKYPLKWGMAKEELRSKTIGSDFPKLFSVIIGRLTDQGEISQERDLVRLSSHQVRLGEKLKKLRDEIENTYKKAGLQPPTLKEIMNQFRDQHAKEILDLLIKDGMLIRVKEELCFHRLAIEDLKERLVQFLKKNGEISTQKFKEMTGASRKFTIPLAEYFDNTHVTVRIGDKRILRKA